PPASRTLSNSALSEFQSMVSRANRSNKLTAILRMQRRVANPSQTPVVTPKWPSMVFDGPPIPLVGHSETGSKRHLGSRSRLVAEWRGICSRLLFRFSGGPTPPFGVREDLSRSAQRISVKVLPAR